MNMNVSKEVLADRALTHLSVTYAVSKRGYEDIIRQERMSEKTKNKFNNIENDVVIEISKKLEVFDSILTRLITNYIFEKFGDQYPGVYLDRNRVHFYANDTHYFFDLEIVEKEEEYQINFINA